MEEVKEDHTEQICHNLLNGATMWQNGGSEAQLIFLSIFYGEAKALEAFLTEVLDSEWNDRVRMKTAVRMKQFMDGPGQNLTANHELYVPFYSKIHHDMTELAGNSLLRIHHLSGLLEARMAPLNQ